MSVRIPISADASAVTNAFEQIRTAIRWAGQEGRAFRDLDLSHPELKDLTSEIQKAQHNFEELARIGRGATASAVRRGGYADFLEWFEGHGRQFPDEAERHRHTAQAGRYILGGTSLNPPAPPLPPPPPDAFSGGGGSGSGGGLPIPIPGLGGIIRTVLTMSGLSAAFDSAMQGVQSAQDEAVANDGLLRTIRDLDEGFEGLRYRVRQASDGLGVTYGEMQRYSLQFAKLTSENDAQSVTAAVRDAAGFARGAGLDPGQVVEAAGQSRFMGLFNDPKRFALLVAEAARAGGMTGRTDEVIQGLLRWSEQASRILVERPNVEAYASMLAAMNATGQPGMRGAAAEALLGQVDQAVRHGGAFGEASQNLTFQALARAGMTDPYQMLYQLEGGALGRLGDRTNFEVIRDQIDESYRGAPRFQRLDALANYFGISRHQAEAMMRLSTTRGALGELGGQLEARGINLEELDPAIINTLADIMGADRAGLEGIRARTLARDDLTDDQRQSLLAANGDGLRAALVDVVARLDMDRTIGTEVKESSTKMQNELTRIGGVLLEPLTAIKDLVAQHLVGNVADILAILKNQFGYDSPEADAALEAMRGKVGLGGSWAGAAQPSTAGLAPDEVSAFLDDLAQRESGGKATAAASTSSALGTFQFTRDTWLSVARRFGGDRVEDLTNEQLLALRTDPGFAREMAAAHLTQDIAPELDKAGIARSAEALYAGWHFGPAGGVNVMKADDDDPMSEAVSRKALEANPYLRGLTVGAWKAKVRKDFGADAAQGIPLPPDDPSRRQQTGGLNHSIRNEVTVIHRNEAGDLLEEEQMPVTDLPLPMPWGVN